MFKKIAGVLGVSEAPIFNTGVMIFNRGSHRLFAAHLDEMVDLADGFRTGRYPYPCNNIHIIEEIAVSLICGALEPFSYSFLRRADAPWYIEWAAGLVDHAGVVLHTWTTFYPFFLLHSGNRGSLRRSPFGGNYSLNKWSGTQR